MSDIAVAKPAIWINHGNTTYPSIDIAKVEEMKNAKFVCELAIKGRFGWTERPAQIYYQEKPPIEGYSNYFALIEQHEGLVITSGESVVGIPIYGVKTAAGEIIYSRFRHDMRKARTADICVDGGLDYIRLVGDMSGHEQVTLTLKGDALVEVTSAADVQNLESKKNLLFAK